MSEYTQITDFSAKDDLPTSDPEKLILGADIDGEFSAISTAITSKLNNNAADVITVADNANEALTITQTGNGGGVLIADSGTGTALAVTNATAQAANTPVLEVGPSVTASTTHGTDCMGVNATLDAPGTAGTNFMLHAHVNSPSATNAYPALLLSRTRGTTASPTQVDDNDGIGTIYFQAQNDTVGVAGLDSGAYIYAEVDETNVTIGADGVPTVLKFYTNAGAGTANFMEVSPEATAQTNMLITSRFVVDPTSHTGTYGATFYSNESTWGALMAYSQDRGTTISLGHNNMTAYGRWGEILNYAADDTSATYSFRAKNQSGFDLFLARSDGQLSTGTRTKSPYNNTTASAANMFVSSGGALFRSTSSARFKKNVQPLADEWADKILDLEPVFYESTAAGDAANPDWTYYGFIAEDVAAVDGRYVHFDTGECEAEEEFRDPNTGAVIKPARPAQGRKPQAEWIPDGVQYERMVVPLINVVKRQRGRIEALEAQLAALADRVTALGG